tara:strand:- start:246 stop:479 length:234 start_codon:yes stop_codon:yes gene_type:complete
MRLNQYDNPIDYSALPYNCPARAAERMRNSFAETGGYNPLDKLIVLGDPTESVEVSNLETMMKQFLKRVQKRSQRTE